MDLRHQSSAMCLKIQNEHDLALCVIAASHTQLCKQGRSTASKINIWCHEVERF